MLRNVKNLLRRTFGAAALSLLFVGTASAQLPTSVDIDLVPGTTVNTLDVRLRANGSSFNLVVSNLVFTVRWSTAAPQTLGLGTSAWCPATTLAFPLGAATGTVSSGGFDYQTYSMVATQQIGQPQLNGGCGPNGQSLPADTWVTVFTIPVSASTTCTTFQIVTNETYTNANNANFFVSLGGTARTGVIEPTAACVSSASCGTTIPTATSNSPLCQGATLNLSATAANGGNTMTYYWVGPNGFTSTLQNPTITNVTPAMSGVYTVTAAINGGCQNFSRNVTVTVVDATVGGPQSLCTLGTTLPLGGNAVPAGSTGTWSIVTGGVTGTFSDPNDPNATFTHLTGNGPITLRWTITGGPCPTETADVVLTLTAGPTVTCPGNSSVCVTAAAFPLTGGSPEFGTYTVDGSPATDFDPAAVGVGPPYDA